MAKAVASRVPTFKESAFADLCLDSVVAKLCHQTRGSAWTFERAIKAVEQYRRWLWLTAAYPDENLSPSREIDAVWHAHILDTAKYAHDCQLLFGRFLHHNPFAGWRDAEADEGLARNWDRTQQLFTIHFRQGDAGVASICNSGGCDTGGCDKELDLAWRPGLPSAQDVTSLQ